jgi:hypothetical protein
LSEPLATDRLNTPKFSQTETESISACRIYCAAYETSQGDRFNRFSAIADLLIIGGEDFFDLSRVLQPGHGYFVRHCWLDALSADELPTIKSPATLSAPPAR